jgi:hypothetical protein
MVAQLEAAGWLRLVQMLATGGMLDQVDAAIWDS